MRFKQFNRKTLKLFLMTAAFCGLFGVNSLEAFAQFTFQGDFDKTFAALNGYYVEPQNNDPSIPSNPARTSLFYTGDLNPDGSLLAGGRILLGDGGDFLVRKFTATGAVDTSFGNGTGYVRTEFLPRQSGQGYNNIIPQVLKRQPDGKILFAGGCSIPTSSGNGNNAVFGSDVCVVRYNADGTLDQTFGNNTVTVGYAPGPYCGGNGQAPCTYTFQPGAGKLTFQTLPRPDNNYFGTNGTVYDIALQPDGKIVLAGNASVNPNGTLSSSILVRLNPNGSLDASFGSGGIARYNTGADYNAFRKVVLQPDGRIIAAGYDSRPNNFIGFFVSRWTAAGTLETTYRIDNTTGNEKAAGLLLTRDGTKVLVSGYAQGKATLARLNIGDLSPDATFGTNGIRTYNYQVSGFDGLVIKAIQPDGKILAVDNSVNSSNVSRLNPDGSPDQSFGNVSFDNNNPKGRLALSVQTNIGTPLSAGHILLRPDGKLNLIGSAGVNYGFDVTRGAVSQNINVSRNGGNLSDFTNDGKSEIAVFRPSTGFWHQLNSANSAYSAFQFGLQNDKLAPADYDGDGKTDTAVFRNGVWYVRQSASGQVRYVNFGLAEDLPRPGDYDGDGLADIAVFRPSDGNWYRLNSSNNQSSVVHFGQNGDVPLIGDFDGDGKTDLTVFRSGIWYILRSSDQQAQIVQFGLAGDIPVVGDYDGDGKSDIAVFRPSNGVWYIWQSSNNQVRYETFGLGSDSLAPADYDGDGKTDVAVFRNGVWYILQSSNNQVNYQYFGQSGDISIQAAYLN